MDALEAATNAIREMEEWQGHEAMARAAIVAFLTHWEPSWEAAKAGDDAYEAACDADFSNDSQHYLREGMRVAARAEAAALARAPEEDRGDVS